jgi:hypothetical protein
VATAVNSRLAETDFRNSSHGESDNMAEIDFIKMYLKNALEKGLKQGSTAVVEDLANGLSLEHLQKLIDILVSVRNKKTPVIEVKRVRE